MKLAMKLFGTLFLLCAATAASATPFPEGNQQAGEKLFAQHQCNHCHDSMMNGDGNKIFTRFNRKINTPAALIDQIGACSGNVNTHFSAQETQSLAAYLNIFYKFK